MIIALIIYALIGVLFIVLGLLIWKKQKVSLIHDYHYRHVKKADIPSYSRLMGIGMLVMGTGFCVYGILSLLVKNGIWCTVTVTVFLIAGLLVFNRAQKKYNGSWFS